MAAPDQVVSFGGQANSSGAADALFLKVWAGEVMTAFREQNVALDRTVVRSIASGKSAQFPATWKATADYHTPGAYILGQQISGNERVITIDDLAKASVFIASIDEAKSHFEFRSEYTFQCGAALARLMDKHLLQVGILAARASATVSGGDGGSQVTSATALTDGDALVQAIFDSAQALDEKNVPEADRFVYVKPAAYNLLMNGTSKLINRDYNNFSGSTQDRGRLSVAGVTVVKTNNLPVGTNVNTGPAAYQVDGTNTAALVMHRSAIGTVKLMDLATEMDYLITNQGTLIVSKLAVGHGILRPESAVEIKTA